MAALGVVSSSVLPLRLTIFVGAFMALLSFFTSLYYFVYKVLYWDTFQLGLAPLIVGFFFTIGILFIFLGILGEYLISIQRFLKNRPLIVEKERINFD
jgi:ABC-type antimicrobial peptide transport system permease subunit